MQYVLNKGVNSPLEAFIYEQVTTAKQFRKLFAMLPEWQRPASQKQHC
jgi:hypothetical protein